MTMKSGFGHLAVCMLLLGDVSLAKLNMDQLWPSRAVRNENAWAQSKGRLSVSDHESGSAVEELMHSVDSLKIEYRSDIQFNAVENGKIASRKLAEQIVQNLFNDAELATYPYPFGVTNTYIDTRDVAVADALSIFHLAALSIKLRAVQALRSWNESKSLEQFQSIHLSAPPTTCKSTLVPELSTYYSLLTSLLNSAIPSGAKISDDLFFWVHAQVLGMSSPLQLAPMTCSPKFSPAKT